MLERPNFTLRSRRLATLTASLSACMVVAGATFCLAGLSVNVARTTWPEWIGALVLGLGFAIGVLQLRQATARNGPVATEALAHPESSRPPLAPDRSA
jgi:hypothetical protein